MVRKFLIDNYKIEFKTVKETNLNFANNKYTDYFMQIIFDDHISVIKKRQQNEWWLLTSNDLIKPDIIMSYDEKDFKLKENIFSYGILYLNYGKKNQDLESVVYLIGKK